MGSIEPYKGIAGIYEEIRPSYPERLIQEVISKTGILPNDRLLEIGAGTGKATLQFAEKGFRIKAIEIGEDMAEILKDKCKAFPKVSVEVAPFEEWTYPQGQKFDMIFSAQSFHWIDKNIKYKKCHELLKDGGYLVLFWYNPVADKPPAALEIDIEVNRIVQKYVTVKTNRNSSLERRTHDGVSDNDERKAEIEASGFFELIGRFEYAEEINNNHRQYLLAMKSVPAFASAMDGLESTVIEDMDREIIEVINRHGGFVSGQFLFTLYLCRKI